MSKSNIKALELKATVGNRTMSVSPTLIWDENDAALIDTANPGFFPIIKGAVEELIPFDCINYILVTHQDIDHIGCLPDFKAHFGDKLKILSHPIEKPYIEGTLPLLKSSPAFLARMTAGLPEEAKAERAKLFANPPKAKVDITLEHGDALPVCGGIELILTPGHTHGHVCFYHRDSKTLIAGDALTVQEGKLFGPNEMMAEDMKRATESLKQLSGYDIAAVICHHGGLFTGDVQKALAEILA